MDERASPPFGLLTEKVLRANLDEWLVQDLTCATSR
jgi:hypothetical protein